MNQELQNKLFDKYPKIFRDRTLPMTQTCMCWGLEIGDGWYKIIEGLCEAMTYSYSTSCEVNAEDGVRLGISPSTYGEITRYFLDVNPPQAVADQVKEKFGTLRFYYHLVFDPKIVELLKTEKYPQLKETMDHYSNYFDGIVHMAETLSGMTCEETGLGGEMHVSGGGQGGWYKVLNSEHAKNDPTLSERNYVPTAGLK